MLSSGHRATLIVLGVIAVSLCFGLLRIVDVAVSGALRHDAAPPAPGAAATMVGDGQADVGAACAIHAVLDDVPSASAAAIDL
jgi:hypothetical protein